MNMMTLRKPKLAAPVDGEDVLAVLDRRLRELDARDAVLLKQQIGLEQTASARPNNDAAEKAEALLGGEPFVATRDSSLSLLEAVLAERKLIANALKIGRSKHHRLAAERATEVWAAHFEQIAEVEKRRVMLALQLQQVNRDRERLREKIIKAGGAGYLSTDGVDLLGLGDLADGEVQWTCERVIADGICTRAEIERAKNG
jgi:hypothetical protein